MLSNGLSKWIYTELSVNWIDFCRQSKSLDHSCQWPFPSASFVDIYNKFSQHIKAYIKEIIKKYCFNRGDIETLRQLVEAHFYKSSGIFEFQKAKTFCSKLCNSKKTRCPWGYLGLVRRKFKQKTTYLQKPSVLLHQKGNLADVCSLRGMHLTGAVSESLQVSSTFSTSMSILLPTQGLSISSWGSKT